MPQIPFDELLKQIDSLSEEERKQLREKLEPDSKEANPAPRSLYDALLERGLIGSITNGPGDLSTNPIHMEGFGENAH
jgi:hypothetical protein